MIKMIYLNLDIIYAFIFIKRNKKCKIGKNNCNNAVLVLK